MKCRAVTIFLLIVVLFPVLQAQSVSLQPCESSRLPDDALCGSYPVYEDRQVRRGRKIDLNIVVLPGRSEPNAPDPVFPLAGGPGQAATQLTPLFANLAGLRRDRDIVMVDQRGTGDSNGLPCSPDDRAEAIQTLLTFRFNNLQECRSRMKADLTLYTTEIAMDDLDEVRAALGYAKINLWGGSYGTRAALVYLRRHPQSVRTMVLRGVAPPPMLVPLSFGQGAQKALDAVFDACRQDEQCQAAYPGLRRQWEELLRQVSETPTRTRIEVGRAGGVELEVNRDMVASSVLFMLYNSGTARRLPFSIDRASRGDWKPLFGFGAAFGAALSSQLSLGMTLSVLCAEDVAFFEEDRIEKSMKGSFLGESMVRNLAQACRQWPGAKVPQGFHQHVRSDVPALLFTGEFDPVTPPQWAATAARHLPNSLHVVMPNTGHVPALPGCSENLMTRFIRTGSAKGLDASCVSSMKRPSFQTP